MLKSFPKILTIFFLAIFIFQLASLIFLFALPVASQAADPASFKPQIEIPGMKEEFGATDKTGGYAIPGSTASIAKYVRVIYKYAIGIVGILAAVVLMVGGVLWIVAGGNATAIGEAKAWIGASLTGLVLALMSYLILATVNPALVDFKVTPVATVQQLRDDDKLIGCCTFKDQSGTIQTNYSRCEYKTRGECRIDKGFYEFYNNQQCSLIADCPQYGNASDSTACSGKTENESCIIPPNLSGKCTSGICKQCIQQGAQCTPDTWVTTLFGLLKKPIPCCTGTCSGLGGAGRCGQ